MSIGRWNLCLSPCLGIHQTKRGVPRRIEVAPHDDTLITFDGIEINRRWIKVALKINLSTSLEFAVGEADEDVGTERGSELSEIDPWGLSRGSPDDFSNQMSVSIRVIHVLAARCKPSRGFLEGFDHRGPIKEVGILQQSTNGWNTCLMTERHAKCGVFFSAVGKFRPDRRKWFIESYDATIYLLEGCRPSYNYRTLHLTSHCFDEPQCLALITRCTQVVTVHGCDGEDPVVLIGGLDTELASGIAAELARAGLAVATGGHRFPATHPDNVCNRGRSGRGVQLEFPHRLRRGGPVALIASCVRAALAGHGR